MHHVSALALALCCSSVWAQPDSNQTHADDIDPAIDGILGVPDSWSPRNIALRDLTFYWDNDGTLPRIGNDTDRFYTNGNGIELSFDPNLTDDLKSKLAPSNEWTDPRFGMGLAIKQLIFTGADITDPAPALDDHPYSGYLYLAFSFQRADKEKHDHFELDLGVVGEQSQGEAVQRFIHNAFPDQDEPQGWSSQLANEPTINFTFERTWKSERSQIKGFELEMLPALGVDLGNVFTRARGQITLRGGMNLPDDFGPATLLGHRDHTTDASAWGEGEWSFYFYTTLGIEAVAWNIFLDGNTFATSRSVDSEPFVVQASAGVITRYKSLYFGWSQTYQTETFETQPSGQAWGAIVFGCSFGY